LDKDYQVACPTEEQDALQRAAAYLQAKMRDIRTTGKVVGSDRIAVMAALNMAHDLLEKDAGQTQFNTTFTERIRLLADKVESTLDENSPPP
jgi:cell division protein ZapA